MTKPCAAAKTAPDDLADGFEHRLNEKLEAVLTEFRAWCEHELAGKVSDQIKKAERDFEALADAGLRPMPGQPRHAKDEGLAKLLWRQAIADKKPEMWERFAEAVCDGLYEASWVVYRGLPRR